MKFNLILLTGLIAIPFFSFSQAAETEKIPHYKQSIGVAAGFSTGYGLSYRYTPTKFGLQATFAPYYSKETQTYSGGLTFLYTLIEAKNTNLFIYQGNHYYYNSWSEYQDPVTNNIYSSNPNLAGVIKKNTLTVM